MAKKHGHYGETCRGYIRGNPLGYFGIGLGFALLGLIAAALSMFSIVFSALALMILLLPFCFAATTLIARVGRGKEVPPHREMFQRGLAYFTPVFRGCYRILFNLLKTLGFTVLGIVATTILLFAIFSATDPSFSSSFQTMMEFWIQGDTASFVRAVNESVSLVRLFSWSSVVGVGAGVWALCWNLTNYAMHPLIKTRTIIFPRPAIARLFYNRFYSLVRRDYHRALWFECFGFPLYPPIGYALGATISLSAGLPYNAAIAIGIASVVLPVAVVYPYFITLMEEFFRHQKRTILQAQVSLMDELYEQFSMMPQVPKDSLEDMKKDIENIKNTLQNLSENEVVEDEREEDNANQE